MKMPDLFSTLAAGLLGALIYVGYESVMTGANAFSGANVLTGFVVGAGVQIGVRLAGVS